MVFHERPAEHARKQALFIPGCTLFHEIQEEKELKLLSFMKEMSCFLFFFAVFPWKYEIPVIHEKQEPQ